MSWNQQLALGETAGGRTVKSSSRCLPFFFFVPRSPSASTSSAIPSAAIGATGQHSSQLDQSPKGLTIEIQVVHPSDISLGLAPDEADAIWLSTVAFLSGMPEEKGLVSDGRGGKATEATDP